MLIRQAYSTDLFIGPIRWTYSLDLSMNAASAVCYYWQAGAFRLLVSARPYFTFHNLRHRYDE